MPEHLFQCDTVVEKPLPEVFSFFSDARNLQRITPPWLHFEVLTAGCIAMRKGTIIDYRLRWHGIPMRWKTEIVVWNPLVEFCDVQLSGPYAKWEHSHRFTAHEGVTKMIDEVRYQLPLGPVGELAHALSVRRSVQGIFEYRASEIKKLFS